MKLIVDIKDLKPELIDKDCRQISFSDFTIEVQTAIYSVGKATFFGEDGWQYIILTPTEVESE